MDQASLIMKGVKSSTTRRFTTLDWVLLNPLAETKPTIMDLTIRKVNLKQWSTIILPIATKSSEPSVKAPSVKWYQLLITRNNARSHWKSSEINQSRSNKVYQVFIIQQTPLKDRGTSISDRQLKMPSTKLCPYTLGCKPLYRILRRIW